MNTGLSQEDTRKIVGLLSVLFPQAKIYLYGSRARGDFREALDINVAIDAELILKFREIDEACDVVEGLTIPYKKDIVDLHRLPQSMQEIVAQGYSSAYTYEQYGIEKNSPKKKFSEMLNNKIID